MKKTFTLDNAEYTISTCTAIAASIGDTERQNALLVESESDSGERTIFVVFGYDMPECESDFYEMCDDSSAWDNEQETLDTVVR